MKKYAMAILAVAMTMSGAMTALADDGMMDADDMKSTDSEKMKSMP